MAIGHDWVVPREYVGLRLQPPHPSEGVSFFTCVCVLRGWGGRVGLEITRPKYYFTHTSFIHRYFKMHF